MHDDAPRGYQKHGHPAETIGLAAVAALGLEAVLPAAGAPGWVLPASEVIASSGAALVTWGFTGRRLFPAYMAVLGGFLGGWSAWAGTAGVWTWDAFGVLTAGMTALVPAGVAAWHRRHRREAPDPLMLTAVPEPLMIAPEPDENEVERGLFAAMFADFGLGTPEEPVDVYSLTEERWGRQVRVRLPKKGHLTIADFQARAANFAVCLEAQDGAVSFEGGGVSSEVIMKIRERDGLAESLSLLPELRARTVNDSFFVGGQEDGSHLKITVRETHIMIVGTTGSGKSNLLNVIIAQLSSMVDTVIWVIDMKSGRAAVPWFQPWEEGRAAAPAIDWLATTRAEAELMITATEKVADVRAASRIGGNKVIPSPGRPQVILIVDESADLIGDATAPTRTELGEDSTEKLNTWFQRKSTKLTQKGRSEAVATIWATQRGTQGMGGTGDFKSNINISVALRPKKFSDLQYIIPDAPHMAARQLQYLCNTPGVGMVANGPHVSQVTKFLHHDHIEGRCGTDEEDPRCVPECPVYRSATECGPVRPRLDALTARALGTEYSQRWVRAQRDGIIRVPQAALSGGSALHGYGSGDAARFEEVLTQGGYSDPDRDLHPARVRLREIVASRPDGISVRRLQEVLDDEFGKEAPVRETLHKWLRDDRENDKMHHPRYRCWKSGPGPNVGDEDD